MQQFEITLKNEKVKFYKSIALLLVILNLAVFIYLLIADVHFYEAAAALLLSAFYIIYLLYNSKKNRRSFFVNEFTFFILAGCWIALQNYLVAFCAVVLAILYHLSLQKIQILFTAEVVKKINFPQKEFSWEVFTNVMMKDNILTMDFKNNKLIQVETENAVDENQFNEFSKSSLRKFSDLSEIKL
jgi:hypothetical protein